MSKLTFPPTAEQQAAIDAAMTGESLKIEAFAGTGKTTTLGHISKAKGSDRGLYLAFNKAIAAEAEGRLSPKCEARTFHSLAYKKYGSKFAPRLQSRLTNRMIVDRFQIAPISVGGTLFSGVSLAADAMSTITRFCRTLDPAITLDHVQRSTLRIPADGQEDAIREEVARAVLPIAQRLWAKLSDLNESDFPSTHDVYLKLYADSAPKIRADYVLFDEAQDADGLMLKVLQAQKCQVIFVGDRHQQIYSWRGAVNAMRRIQTKHTTHLTQSFRFGPDIAALASDLLAHMGEDLPLIGNPAVQSSIESLNRPAAILCRTNAEVAAQYFDAPAGLRIATTGLSEVKAFLRAFIALSRGAQAEGQYALFKSAGELREYAQSASGADLRPYFKLIANRDATDVLSALDRALDADRPDCRADLVISTAHKAKGLEWSSVKLAGDFSTPSTPDILARGLSVPDEDLRLLYVALTRAKTRLDVTSVNFDFLESTTEPVVQETL